MTLKGTNWLNVSRGWQIDPNIYCIDKNADISIGLILSTQATELC